VVSDDPLPPGQVTLRMRIANFAFKMVHLDYIVFIHYSTSDQARSTKFGSKYGQMDFYTNSAFQVQKGRGLWSRDPISKFWDSPSNF